MKEIIDLTGQRFGHLVPLERVKNENGVFWKCKCDCGNVILARTGALRHGDKKSCGCERFPKVIDLTGKRFGKLTVLSRCGYKSGRTAWLCKCDCGNEKVIVGHNLLKGMTTSCGCVHKENTSKASQKHGMSATRIYGIWIDMKNRCSNPNCERYERYGGRGIKICDEWSGENGAENFIRWAYENGYNENAPFGECTIDRIDVNGDYSPENCRWITNQEQQYNTSRTRILEYNGETLTTKQASERFGIGQELIRLRLSRGWGVKKTIETPIRKR